MSKVQVDPEILGGIPCFRGMRVPVETLIDYLVPQFPTVTREQAKSMLESFKTGIAAVHEASK